MRRYSNKPPGRPSWRGRSSCSEGVCASRWGTIGRLGSTMGGPGAVRCSRRHLQRYDGILALAHLRVEPLLVTSQASRRDSVCTQCSRRQHFSAFDRCFRACPPPLLARRPSSLFLSAPSREPANGVAYGLIVAVPLTLPLFLGPHKVKVPFVSKTSWTAMRTSLVTLRNAIAARPTSPPDAFGAAIRAQVAVLTAPVRPPLVYVRTERGSSRLRIHLSKVTHLGCSL